MASNDFIQLMDLIFKQKKRIEKINVKFSDNDENVRIDFTDNSEPFVSTEGDVADYAWHIQKTIDSDGEYELVAFKNIEKYYNDINFLIDRDQSKIKQASKELAEGKYHFSVDPDELIENFLNSKSKNKSSFLPLKTEYFYIIAYQMNLAATALKQYQEKAKTSEKFDKDYKLLEAVYAEAFRNDGNFIKNFLKQRRTNNFNLLEYMKQVKSVASHLNLQREIFPKNGIKTDMGIQLVLNTYRTLAEACVQPLNLLRIGYEFSLGITSPKLNKSASLNKQILEPALDAILECYDPRIRNSESHLSTEVDEQNKKVIFWNRSKKGHKFAVEYTYTQLLSMTNELMHDLVPALSFTIYMEWRTLLLIIVFKSIEYKQAILKIDN